MLLFINPGYVECTLVENVSIHLMLLFIVQRPVQLLSICLFQYISCYSLSFWDGLGDYEPILFQYISCYSLSIKAATGQKITVVFQYISCYSLSSGIAFSADNGACFNTSHVTLYQDWILQWVFCFQVSIHLMLLFIDLQVRRLCPVLLSFNTSHVTLYRDSRWKCKNRRKVSIHLMLLFIR